MTDSRIAIGFIRTSFAFQGELKVASFSGEIDHFLGLKEIFLKDKNGRFLLYEVESSRKHKGTLLLKLAGIDTPEQVKKLHGVEIWVDRKFAAPKADDEYYYADLCLCSVILDEKKIGRINSLIQGHWCELLEVITIEGKTILVPFVDAFVGNVDIGQGKVYLKEAAAEL